LSVYAIIFIFFGTGGEVASNRLEDQELSVHALYLLQVLPGVRGFMIGSPQAACPHQKIRIAPSCPPANLVPITQTRTNLLTSPFVEVPICNTPVEVQFTSAGCLNYPCRNPPDLRLRAGRVLTGARHESIASVSSCCTTRKLKGRQQCVNL
jgi:hypothetical protein